MQTRLTAEANLWRWPGAAATEINHRWCVELGSEAIPVLPRGVEAPWDSDDDHVQIQLTLHEIHEQLREIGVNAVPVAAALLAEHCRQFPAPILCQHGLGRAHVRGGCDAPERGGEVLLDVEHVVAMIAGLDGLAALAYHLATQRKPARPRQVENALVWPVLPPDYVALVRAEMERDRSLLIERAKQLVTLSISEALRQSRLELAFDWAPYGRPEMVLAAHSDLAAYLADFARHIGTTTDADHSVTCVVCGQPHIPARTPKSGATYCTNVECQRERNRRNQARRRARQRGED